MKRIFTIIVMLLFSSTIAMTQNANKNPKDLWTHSVDVTLGDHWKQKTIIVPGKGTPNVVDFLRAFAQAYPCEYHDLLLSAIDGDKEVLFCGSRPYIEIDKDSCFLENESFAMRVFYEKGKPAALGVCCHKAITTPLQDAYYYRYSTSTRKLTPMAKGSDFTGGIVKRMTEFAPEKESNEATMHHTWGRCSVQGRLKWDNGKFEYKELTWEDLMIPEGQKSVRAVFEEYLERYEMELRDPKESITDDIIVGGSFNSLPICVAIHDLRSNGRFEAAEAMEGFYHFQSRGWDCPDGALLVGIYMACAPKNDYGKDESGEYVTSPHKLGPGDDVSLCFYYCLDGMALYLDPSSPNFANLVGKGFPNLKGNEWRCVLSPDNEDLVFTSEKDGKSMVFRWNGKQFEKQ